MTSNKEKKSLIKAEKADFTMKQREGEGDRVQTILLDPDLVPDTHICEARIKAQNGQDPSGRPKDTQTRRDIGGVMPTRKQHTTWNVS